MGSFPAYRRTSYDDRYSYNPFRRREDNLSYSEDRNQRNNTHIVPPRRIFNRAEAINSSRRNALSDHPYGNVEAMNQQSPFRNWFRNSYLVEDRNDQDYLPGFRHPVRYSNRAEAVNGRRQNVGPFNRSYRSFNNVEDMNEQYPVLNPFILPPAREHPNVAETFSLQIEVERHPFHPGGELFHDVEAVNKGFGGNMDGSTETKPMVNNAGEAESSDHECLICWADKFKNPVKTPCSHTFCYGCLLKWFRTRHWSCPICRRVFNFRDLVDMEIIRLPEVPGDHRDGDDMLRRLQYALNERNEADEARRRAARRAIAERLSPIRIAQRFVRACRDLMNRD